MLLLHLGSNLLRFEPKLSCKMQTHTNSKLTLVSISTPYVPPYVPTNILLPKRFELALNTKSFRIKFALAMSARAAENMAFLF